MRTILDSFRNNIKFEKKFCGFIGFKRSKERN
jgi:hypothetical protein